MGATGAALAPSPRQAERVHLALIRSELEVAFSYLRLAEAEVHGGILTHAEDLLDKARTSHTTAVRYLSVSGEGFDGERAELHAEARELADAIRRTGLFLLPPAI